MLARKTERKEGSRGKDRPTSIGWRRGSQGCRVPETLSSHAHGKSHKAYRGINKALSKTILKRAGIFIPAGSGESTYFC